MMRVSIWDILNQGAKSKDDSSWVLISRLLEILSNDLPQVADENIPRPVDVVGEYLL